MTTTAPVKPPPVKTRGKRARDRAHNALGEIYVGSAAKAAQPTVVVRDDLAAERRPPGPFRGRVYLGWMEHDPDGACDRDPLKDPHEDLAYVGKTCRPLATRWREHLLHDRPGEKPGDGRRPNNSAIYRHRANLTGFSADPRVYDTPEALAAAETRAIKTLWPAWNIQDQDRRNPHTRATRGHRRPDRLAPLIGAASVLWGLLWAGVTAGLLWISWTTRAPWWTTPVAPLIALYLVNGTFLRHTKTLAKRSARRRRR